MKQESRDFSREECQSSFLRYPDEDGIVYGRFDDEFKEYTEENIGIHEGGYY